MKRPCAQSVVVRSEIAYLEWSPIFLWLAFNSGINGGTQGSDFNSKTTFFRNILPPFSSRSLFVWPALVYAREIAGGCVRRRREDSTKAINQTLKSSVISFLCFNWLFDIFFGFASDDQTIECNCHLWPLLLPACLPGQWPPTIRIGCWLCVSVLLLIINSSVAQLELDCWMTFPCALGGQKKNSKSNWSIIIAKTKVWNKSSAIYLGFYLFFFFFVLIFKKRTRCFH